MAASDQSLGYQCEFVDPVPEDFYCKNCNLVARKFTITSCCGETYCHACIADTQEQGKPCPACAKKDFTLTEQMKYQKKIKGLQVYCSMKERGCGWSGTLEQLDTHLDPDQDNCQYVDTKCPLNCHMTIPKNNVKQHVAQHCAKRPYVCQHCNFKATYEEVVDKHLPECKYVPLQCPNLCGVTFERDFMEDHMKMCRLEDVECEFSGVGCDGRFRREEQEDYTRQNSQKHLTLTASLAVETREQLQDQVAKYREIEQNLKQKLEEQDQKLKELEQKLKEQDQHKKKQDQKLNEQDQKLNEQDQKLEEQKYLLTKFTKLLKWSEETEAKLSCLMTRTFKMENFSKEKEKGKDLNSRWYGPAMYTHVDGYKFYIAVLANGIGDGRGKAVAVQLYSLPGEFDGQLKWPVKDKFTLELVNQRGGDNVIAEAFSSWDKPDFRKCITNFHSITVDGYYHFIKHSQLEHFLVDDTLHFLISNRLLLNY